MVLGLRIRVTLLVVGLVAVVQLGWGLSVIKTDTMLLRGEAEHRGLQVLRALAVSCAVALANREVETLDAVLASFTTEEGRSLDLLAVAILDSDGKVLAHTDPVQFGRRAVDPFTRHALVSESHMAIEHRDDGIPVMRLSMPIRSGLRWGTATAVLSLESVEQQVRSNRTRVLALSLTLAVSVGLLLSLLLRQSVLEPLRRLAGAAKEISLGQLDARVAARSGGDEMALLGTIFNEMADKVQWQTEALEGKVEERTRQLQDPTVSSR
jgi:sensor histidine kinase regulating citrate/malate metabolism